MKITETVRQFAEPVVQAHGCSLWDVEYVREGADWFLRLYIDKPGGVDINDCEAISRAVEASRWRNTPDQYSSQFVSSIAVINFFLKSNTKELISKNEVEVFEKYSPRIGVPTVFNVEMDLSRI